MTYVDAIKTVFSHSNKAQIFQRSSYLCAYLADLIGGIFLKNIFSTFFLR